MPRLKKLFGRRKSTMEDLRRAAIKAEAAADRMRQQRDRSDKENNDLLERLAGMAAEKKFQDDHIRHLEASLSGVREELRQERVARARDAEGLTAEVLGSAMRRLEIPGQRDGEVSA